MLHPHCARSSIRAADMVQFKTVKGDSFSLDLPETATVRALVARA